MGDMPWGIAPKASEPQKCPHGHPKIQACSETAQVALPLTPTAPKNAFCKLPSLKLT